MNKYQGAKGQGQIHSETMSQEFRSGRSSVGARSGEERIRMARGLGVLVSGHVHGDWRVRLV